MTAQARKARPGSWNGKDHYAVLGVLRTATSEEIRASFKKLVLAWHPDKNPRQREHAERFVRDLIQAYDILSDAESRAVFDQELRARGGARRRPGDPGAGQPKVEPFFFRKDDPEARALRILYLLLNRRERQAVDLLEVMERDSGTAFLHDQLSREDYLDCLFLLGEFHSREKEYAQATRRLEAFYDHEKNLRFPRHYLDEVVRRLKDLYLRKLPRQADTVAALRGLRKAKDLSLTRTEEVVRCARMAEIFIRDQRTEEARVVLDRAERIQPGTKTVEQLRTVLCAQSGARHS